MTPFPSSLYVLKVWFSLLTFLPGNTRIGGRESEGMLLRRIAKLAVYTVLKPDSTLLLWLAREENPAPDRCFFFTHKSSKQEGDEEGSLTYATYLRQAWDIQTEFLITGSNPFSCSKRIAKSTFLPPSVIILKCLFC